MINDNKNESKLGLSSQQLTDQDMEIVAYYLLRNNTVRKCCLLLLFGEVGVELCFVFLIGAKQLKIAYFCKIIFS